MRVNIHLILSNVIIEENGTEVYNNSPSLTNYGLVHDITYSSSISPLQHFRYQFKVLTKDQTYLAINEIDLYYTDGTNTTTTQNNFLVSHILPNANISATSGDTLHTLDNNVTTGGGGYYWSSSDLSIGDTLFFIETNKEVSSISIKYMNVSSDYGAVEIYYNNKLIGSDQNTASPQNPAIITLDSILSPTSISFDNYYTLTVNNLPASTSNIDLYKDSVLYSTLSSSSPSVQIINTGSYYAIVKDSSNNLLAETSPVTVSSIVFAGTNPDFTSISETTNIIASDGAASDYFGTPVSISGDTIVVGSWGDDDKEVGQGLYMFTHVLVQLGQGKQN